MAENPALEIITVTTLDDESESPPAIFLPAGRWQVDSRRFRSGWVVTAVKEKATDG